MANAKDPCTVFVRGVSFDATEKDLEAVFSDVGPVKHCFLVREKGDTRHKGFGFVQFALEEDAERSVEQLHGKEISGRKVKVEVAIKRAPLEERNKKRKAEKAQQAHQHADGVAEQQAPTAVKANMAAIPNAPAENRPAKRQRTAADAAAAEAKHKLLRAVAIGNLTPQALSQAIALARAAGQVEEVMNPAPQELITSCKLAADGCSGLVVVVIYKTVKEAMHAVSQLHNKSVVPGQSSKPKKQKQGAQQQGNGDAAGAAPAAITLWCRELKGEGALVKHWRVIVRNLPFRATEPQLLKLMSEPGFVWELRIPRNPDGKSKGFGFASYTCKAHAEQAIQAINGKEFLGRTIVVDWAVSKAKYEQLKGGNASSEPGSQDPESADGDDGDGSVGAHDDEDVSDYSDGDSAHESDEDDQDDDDEDDGEDSDEVEAGMGSSDEDDDEDENDEEDGEDGDEDPAAAKERDMLKSVMGKVLREHEGGGKGKKDQQSDDEDSNDEGSSSDGDDEDDEDDDVQGQQQGKASKAERQQQREQEVAAAKAALAAASKRPRPEWQGDEAPDPDPEEGDPNDPSSAAARSHPASTSGCLHCTVFVRNLPLDTLSASLQAKMESYGSVKACRLVMDKKSGKAKGTAFVEFRTPIGAERAAEACAKQRRNEGPGVVVGGRPVDVDLAVDQDTARQIAKDKADGRVSTGKDRRNLYLSKEGHIAEGSRAWNTMSEHDRAKRKRAAEERNTKLRSPNFLVSRTRLSVRNIPFTFTEAQLKEMFVKAVKERATLARPQIRSVKILREEGRYDAEGRRRSKGLGFVEFTDHEHALAALRQLNNSPTAPFGSDKRPIVEFAIENVKVLKQIEHWASKAAAKKSAGSGDAAAGDRPRQQQHKPAKGSTGGSDGGPAGDGEGADQEQQKLSRRQRKRIAQKTRAERKHHVAKYGAPPEQKHEGDGAGKDRGGRQPGKDRPQRPNKDNKPRGKDRGAGGDDGDQGSRQQQGKLKGGKQQQQARQQGKQAQAQAQQQTQRSGAEVHDAAVRQRKRAADQELDRIAAEALHTSHQGKGAQSSQDKRRRRASNEGGDKLDKLVEVYKKKLIGSLASGGGGDGGAKAKGKGAATGGGGGGNGGVSAGLKRWFD